MDRSLFNIGQQYTQQSYMDLQSLQSIRKEAKGDIDAGLQQVAQQFESVFIQIMLKSMRSANDVFGKENPLNTFESDMYRDMYDNQLSVSLAGQNLGIADALYRQLTKEFNPTVSSLNNIDYSTTTVPQRIKDARAINQVNDKESFVQLMTPYAKKAAQEMGVDHRVLVAQSALETGWGKHLIRDQYGNQSFNLFNIKADSRWQGKAVAVPTMEFKDGIMQKEIASFRRYSSIAESFADYQHFLQQPRYKKALEAVNNPDLFIQKLQQAGYATDPEYAKKIQKIMKHPLLQAAI